MTKKKDERYPDTVGKFRGLVPSGTKHYLRETLKFDDYTQTLVLDLIESGENLHTAAQIAGVASATLTHWILKGRQSEDPTDAYFKFFQRYTHARLRGLAILREKQRRRRADPQGYGDEPRMNQYNSLPYALFTEENKQSVLQYLREGTFDVVAAEASRIPAQVYLFWISEGKREMSRGETDGEFYRFYIDAMQVAAMARAQAETRVWEDMPLAYLLHGPARNKPEMPGWSKTTEVSGPNGGPLQIETSWKTAITSVQAVEGTVEPLHIPETTEK